MPLTFYTKDHQMTFADKITKKFTRHCDLIPGREYDVFFIIQSDDIEYSHVSFEVTHGPFGIGIPADVNLITQQPSPVNVPPKYDAWGLKWNGFATVSFSFTAPAGGHGCFNARNILTGETLYQNTYVQSVTHGEISNHSFLVYGSSTLVSMDLKLIEKLEDGSTALDTWKPSLDAPADLNPINIPNGISIKLPVNSCHSIVLKVNVPPMATQARVFNISASENGRNVGEVDFLIAPSIVAIPKPDPYLIGGYTSTSIILYDSSGTEVHINDSYTLIPDTEYGFAARVYNNSTTNAINTVVRFWGFNGGFNKEAILTDAETHIDIQTANIPASSSVIVHSSKPFKSAAAGKHRCAVVSIYNAMTDSPIKDAVISGMVPDPLFDTQHSWSAWRNTESKVVKVNGEWTLVFETDEQPPQHVATNTLHVDEDFHNHEEVIKYHEFINETGTIFNQPVYMINSVQKFAKIADNNIKCKTEKGVELDAIQKLHERPDLIYKVFNLNRLKGKQTLYFSDTLPRNAKPGDVVVVKFIAQYNETEDSPKRDVEFIELLKVIE